MKHAQLLLRWSWRDLRAHWAKVIAIALVIAIGTGGYTGLTSNANWRRASYEASYASLDMYDVRVALATGSATERGSLAAAIGTIEHADWIEAVEERLVVPTQLDADTADGAVLVRGEMTGSDFSDGGPHVNGYHAFTGRLLDETDAGEPVVMLDRSFAAFHELEPTGTIEIAGGRSLAYASQATTPEYYAVAPEGELFLSAATFAGVFTTLETAQALSGMDNQVNEAVLTLVSEADRDLVVAEVERTLEDLEVGTQVTTRDDNAAYQTLTKDVENDQQMFNALAFLLFAGAVMAAFILIHRLAQQQRREIGVSMALGVSPRQIAARPLLVSAQIALLGVVLGVGVGVLIGLGFQSLLVDLIPLPIWDTSFQTGLFATVAVVGFLIPFLATGIPVWRAVRVAPVEAIKPTHLSTHEVKGTRRTHRHLNTFSLMPWRNLRRSRWRTGFTILAIAFVLTVLVAFLGVLDSFNAALDTAASEDAGSTPDRLVVGLDSFYPTSADELAAIGAASTVAAAEPSLRLGGAVSSDGAKFDILIDLIDLESEIWTPTLVEGNIDGTPGLVLAEKAAADLGAGVGDTITLRHPVRTGAFAFSFTETAMPILAVHPHPIRTFAYMDVAHADLMGLPEIVNMVQVAPESGASDSSVQRELFDLDGVASVQSVAATTETVKDQMGAFIGIIQMMAFVILFMALLIAFLTASISLDARAREHATMAAFGVRNRTMMRMAMTESFIIGVAATLLGVAGGIAAVWWMTSELFSSTLPEFGMEVVLAPATVAITMILGIGAVTIAPLFTVRRLRRMDVPGTLRLVE